MPVDFKSKNADPNKLDNKYKWSPLIMAIN